MYRGSRSICSCFRKCKRFASLFYLVKFSQTLICFKSLSLRQLEGDLGAWWGERRSEVLFRDEVRLKRGKSSEAVVESADVGMVRENSLVGTEGEGGLHKLE